MGYLPPRDIHSEWAILDPEKEEIEVLVEASTPPARKVLISLPEPFLEAWMPMDANTALEEAGAFRNCWRVS